MHENLFLPREAKIIHTSRPTASEKHFTLQLADRSRLDFVPGQILEVGVMGFGESPIGLASRLNSVSVRPASRNRASRSSWVRRDPIAPM